MTFEKDSKDTLERDKSQKARIEESYSTWQLPTPSDHSSSSSPDYKNLRKEINLHAKDLRHTFVYIQERLKHIQDFTSYPDNLHLSRDGTNLISGGWWFSTYVLSENCRIENGQRVKAFPAYQNAVNTVIRIACHLKEIRRANLRQKFSPLIENVIREFTNNPKTEEMMNQSGGLKLHETMSFSTLHCNQIENLSYILDTVSAEVSQTNNNNNFQTEADRAEAYHNREIFHRSMNSKAWHDFRKTVELKRDDLILDVVTATHEKCNRLLRHLTKLNLMLLSGNVITQLQCFSCLKSVRMVESLKKWRVLAVRLMKIPDLPQEDRVLLYSVTLDMKYSFEKIIQSTESLVFMLMELVNVVYISSRYLKKTFHLKIKGYSALEKVSKEYGSYFPITEDTLLTAEVDSKTKSKKGSLLTPLKNKPSAESNHSNASNNNDEGKITQKGSIMMKEEDPFYLRDYAKIHRKNAITIGDLQLILQSKIKHRHSMMMLDGPRFVDLDLKHHIWLSKARKSLQKDTRSKSSRKIRSK